VNRPPPKRRNRTATELRAARRKEALVEWPGVDEAAWRKTFASVIREFGSLPPADQHELATRLAFAVMHIRLNTGGVALAAKDMERIRRARAYLKGIDDVRVRAADDLLDAASAWDNAKRKQPHTILLEGLFDAYVSMRRRHPETGGVGFDRQLLAFISATLKAIGLGQVGNSELPGLIGKEDVRGAWQRWIVHR
jgi:hypothetical protein